MGGEDRPMAPSVPQGRKDGPMTDPETDPRPEPAAGSAPETGPDPDARHRVLRFRDPHVALGHAVVQLMGKPGFARLPFGEWSRVLVGQINRGEYLFVARAGALVGFGGWSFADQAVAERWLAGQGDIGAEETGGGDCMIINAWQADDPAAQAFLVDQMRHAGRHVRMIYGRRSYPDGRVRMLRLPVLSRTVEGHIARARQDGEGQTTDETGPNAAPES